MLAVLAELAAAVSDAAAEFSDASALVAEVVADAASTNRSHYALSVFVVKGCEPDEV